jgi:hypothetical protein
LTVVMAAAERISHHCVIFSKDSLAQKLYCREISSKSGFSVFRRRWIVKHVAGVCGVNLVMVQRKQKQSSACPRCGEEETPTHVWQCQDEEAKRVWQDAIFELKVWMESQETLPAIITAICDNLTNWQEELPPTDSSEEWANIQNNIGWVIGLEGCLSHACRQWQHEHFMSISSKRSAFRWITALIQKLWQVAWNIWEHGNSIESAQDKEEFRRGVNQEVENCLLNFQEGRYKGEEYRGYFIQSELEKVKDRNTAYKAAWVQNIQSVEKYYK